MKMIVGLTAGLFWALDTVIIGVALSMLPFMEHGQALVLAPFVSTFFHDLFSCIWMFLYMGVKRQYKKVWRALKTRQGRYIMLGALFGGPVGMTGYVLSIRYLGASYTAMISAIYPALGGVLAYIFLKERLSRMQVTGLFMSMTGMVILGYTAGSERPEHFGIGLFCALLCVVGWATEIVICAYGLRNSGIHNEHALMIRQTTSVLFYGCVLLNVVGGWNLTLQAAGSSAFFIISCSALCGTISYLCYYKTIGRIGASKSMALNITYSAWAILLELLLFGTVPGVKKVLCAVFILSGSLITANDWKKREAKSDGLFGKGER